MEWRKSPGVKKASHLATPRFLLTNVKQLYFHCLFFEIYWTRESYIISAIV